MTGKGRDTAPRDFFPAGLLRFCGHMAAGRHQEAAAVLREAPEREGGDGESLRALRDLLRSVTEREERLADLVAELAALRDSRDRRADRLADAGRRHEAGFPGTRRTAAPHCGRAMRRLFAQADRVASAPVPVLITGETGTGKGMLARYIHEAGSRAASPMVSLNCAAIPAALLESELFGIEKGVASGVSERAGHFESASGGTLFLDEIGDMPPECQAKILNALESGEILRVGGRKPLAVDARLISATHRDLEEACAGGRFRQDLFYRIKVIHLHIPPLRERSEEIAPLAAHFLRSAAGRCGLPFSPVLAPAALRLLEGHAWPGNVRELEHEMERAALLSAGPLIQPGDFSPRIAAGRVRAADLPRKLRGHPDLLADITRRMAAYSMKAAFTERKAAPPAASPNPFFSLAGPDGAAPTLRRTEYELVRRAMDACGGNKTRAAAMLGVTREGLRKKLKRLGLSAPLPR
ncbi:MAG: sigma-54 dependent transcriptional regulator [Desulfovibrio sp.]|jgi:DNA-binding NtrC family response regulator|nr:sigma-54 dependent transcriptional regulator [Desulfovibrio sp.]